MANPSRSGVPRHSFELFQTEGPGGSAAWPGPRDGGGAVEGPARQLVEHDAEVSSIRRYKVAGGIACSLAVIGVVVWLSAGDGTEARPPAAHGEELAGLGSPLAPLAPVGHS